MGHKSVHDGFYALDSCYMLAYSFTFQNKHVFSIRSFFCHQSGRIFQQNLKELYCWLKKYIYPDRVIFLRTE